MVVRTYKLRKPVTVGNYTCTELKLNRPITKDFCYVGTLNAETIDDPNTIVKMLFTLSGVPEEVIKHFDVNDLARLRVEYNMAINSYFGVYDYPDDPPAEETETPPPKEME